MPGPRRDNSAGTPRRAPSIRSVVALTMIAPAVVLTVTLVALASFATRSIGDRLGQTALREAIGRAEAEVGAYLGEAERFSATLAATVRSGLLPLDDLDRWPPVIADQLPAFPAVAIVVFAGPDAEVVGVVNDPQGPLSLRGREGTMHERPLGPDDRRPGRTYDFDPASRPWHRRALEHDAPDWTRPYPFVRRALPGFDVGTSYTRALRGDDGTLVGVLSVDVTFGGMDAFLAGMPLSLAGRVVVVDGDGIVVADSHEPSTDGQGQRRAAPAAFAPVLARTKGGRPAEAPGLAHLDGVAHVVSAARLPIGPQRDWTIVAAVPQALVRRTATTTLRRLVLVSAIAMGLVLVASLWLGRRIADPIRTLSEHVRRLGAGEVDRRLDLRAAREFEQLSDDLNVMARDLAERTRLRASIGLAAQVHRALLPAADLVRPGLELHGVSRFCDTIGGDYFDFVELPERQAVLVAVGDVMGHGIDSALLMATARAALRSEVRRTESLGAMLIRVNGVLLQGGAHGRFMTMFLLMIEPTRRRLRWANAGHEPGLLVVPGAGEPTETAGGAIRELAGGDIPLGIDAGVVYFEQSWEDVPDGSLVMVGTDGVREALNPVGEAFGEGRIRELLGALVRTDAELPLPAIATRLTDAVDAHRGSAPVIDDLTFVLARLAHPTAGARR